MNRWRQCSPPNLHIHVAWTDSGWRQVVEAELLKSKDFRDQVIRESTICWWKVKKVEVIRHTVSTILYTNKYTLQSQTIEKWLEGNDASPTSNWEVNSCSNANPREFPRRRRKHIKSNLWRSNQTEQYEREETRTDAERKREQSREKQKFFAWNIYYNDFRSR